jgi:hypothetical protein
MVVVAVTVTATPAIVLDGGFDIVADGEDTEEQQTSILSFSHVSAT